MREDKKTGALDPTQAPRPPELPNALPETRVAPPSQANTSPGADATLAAASATPTAPGGSVSDDTLAPDSAVSASGTTSPPIVVRAGGKDDYRDLRPIDPQHYVVGKEIARGGMGRILTARDRRLGRPVAIKELLTTSGDLRARFEREARITAKLQHPSIVNILEAGAWPSGEPFYVMKLVSGESLDQVIAGRQTLAERLGLLPNVIATVDALAYAHANRVIHRDLKPANVLVGEFGETVVIDWGLAKDLTDTSPDAPDIAVGPYRTSPAAPGATVVGSVMGTPAYMPAEQARGDAVDERADVYALGAMLYHVLAGAPPYTGTTTDLILDAVIAGPPPPLAARAPGVPPDLVTIVAKAMAHAAGDRYPTAKELADDLKKFQTGQLVGAHHYSSWQLLRRWLRRHRTPVAVAAVAATILALVGATSVRRILREQAATEVQRQAAEQSRGEAEDLMSFMLVDLRDKLQPLGKLDLLDDVAKKAVTYYDRRGANLSDGELVSRALALRNLGDVLWSQGNADGALREYRASLALCETLSAKDPTNAERQAAEAKAHEKVGDVLLAQANTTDALVEYRASLSLSETLAAKDPTSTDRQSNVASGHEKVGDVLNVTGNAAGALAEYRASIAIKEQVATKDPTAGRQWDLVIGHAKVGDVIFFALGDKPAALAEYRIALAIAEKLVTNDPTNAVWLRAANVCHERVGLVLVAQGDADGALAEYRSSLDISSALAAHDPTNADLQRNVSLGHEKVGGGLLAQGDTAGALVEFRSARAIHETLTAKDPTNADWEFNRAVNYQHVGDALLAQGDTAAALAEYREYVAASETLVAKNATNAEWQKMLSFSHRRVGNALLARGDAAGAAAEYRTALAILATLVKNDPSNVDSQASLAGTHEDVGEALLAQKDTAGALAEFRAARAIVEALAANDPTNAIRQYDIAVSRLHIGDALLAQGDAAGALIEYRALLAAIGTAAANEPTDANLQVALAESHERVGDALLAQGDRSGALAEYQAAVPVAQQLQRKAPKNQKYRKTVDSLAKKVATCCGAKGTKR